jgi:hypothetical protein
LVDDVDYGPPDTFQYVAFGIFSEGKDLPLTPQKNLSLSKPIRGSVDFIDIWIYIKESKVKRVNHLMNHPIAAPALLMSNHPAQKNQLRNY